MHVNALLLAVVIQQPAEQVTAEDRQQLRTGTQQRQVMRDVPRHTAVPYINMPGIGIRRDERVIERGQQIHIRPSDNRNYRSHD